MLLDFPIQQALRHGTHDGIDVLAVLEEQDARDRTDIEPHSRLLVRIDVDLNNLDLALELITGQSGSTRETNPEQGVELVFIGDGPGKLELLEPTAPDTPVGRFLAKRGPGLHHIAYRVADLKSALKKLRDAGVKLIDEE